MRALLALPFLIILLGGCGDRAAAKPAVPAAAAARSGPVRGPEFDATLTVAMELKKGQLAGFDLDGLVGRCGNPHYLPMCEGFSTIIFDGQRAHLMVFTSLGQHPAQAIGEDLSYEVEVAGERGRADQRFFVKLSSFDVKVHRARDGAYASTIVRASDADAGMPLDITLEAVR